MQRARLPIVQYCLGLKRAASQNSEDPFQPLDDEMRIKLTAMDRLRAMGEDDWAKVDACGKRVQAAGGLVAIDPVGSPLFVAIPQGQTDFLWSSTGTDPNGRDTIKPDPFY